MRLLIDKYKPKKITDILGQDKLITQIIDILKKTDASKKRSKRLKNSKAIFFYGPSGCGKTATACCIANHFDYELYEVNASDIRNTEQLDLRIRNAIKQKSLFAKGKLILIDEVDALSSQDRGGITALIKIIEDSPFPIIVTATNPFEDKIKPLIKKSILIEFEALNNKIIIEALKKICDCDGFEYNLDILKAISRKSGGDLRAAINDLELLKGEDLLKENLKEIEEVIYRTKSDNMISALNRIFKTNDLKLAITAFDNVNEDVNKHFLWIDENIPKEYTSPEELAKAYEMLSKADVFHGRIQNSQYYRFLVYVNALLTAGIASSKYQTHKGIVDYNPTKRILKIWLYNQRSIRKKAIAQKISSRIHTSKKEALKNTMFYLPFIFKNISKNQEVKSSIINELNLTNEEVEWLN